MEGVKEYQKKLLKDTDKEKRSTDSEAITWLTERDKCAHAHLTLDADFWTVAGNWSICFLPHPCRHRVNKQTQYLMYQPHSRINHRLLLLWGNDALPRQSQVLILWSVTWLPGVSGPPLSSDPHTYRPMPSSYSPAPRGPTNSTSAESHVKSIKSIIFTQANQISMSFFEWVACKKKIETLLKCVLVKDIHWWKIQHFASNVLTHYYRLDNEPYINITEN